MGVSWNTVVEELFNKLGDLLLTCTTCSSEAECVDELSKSLPMDIKILSSCCACVLESVIESIPGVERMYSVSPEGETIAIYRLSDAVIEITSSNVVVVPMTRLDSYIELLDEMGYENSEEIKKWLTGWGRL